MGPISAWVRVPSLGVAALVIAAASGASCGSTCSNCTPAISLQSSVAPGSPCTVILSNGERAARYIFPAVGDKNDAGIDFIDAAVCDTSGPFGSFVSGCTTDVGPKPTGCSRAPKCLSIDFWNADAATIQAFLGSDTFDVTVLCEGRPVHFERGGVGALCPG